VRALSTIAVVAAGAVLLGRAGAASGAKEAFGKTVFARGFDSPVLLTYAPGEPGTVYVVEQSGKVIRLYTSIGDGGSGGDPEDRAQDMRSQFGKLLTLDVSKPAAKWSIAALGLRNPWRFSFDRSTGDLYLGDVGQGSIEEIDFTPRASSGLENYGWDGYEGSRRFESGNPGGGTLVFPVFEYGHDEGCSVTGGYVYRGSARAAERGRYIFGDYCSGKIWSFRVEAGAATDVRAEPFEVDSVSSFGENAAGELFAVSHDGTIFRLS